MPDHTPTDAYDERQDQASSMNEENPPTVPEGIAVRDMMRVKYEPRASNEVLIITGYSGAGRTGAARALEDLDWYVVDNLPPTMLPALVGMMSNDPAAGVHRLAVGVDVRSRTFFRTLDATLDTNRTAARIPSRAPAPSWTASRPRCACSRPCVEPPTRSSTRPR